MARSIYVASTQGDAVKSMIALGLLETLTKSVARVGVFRPVVRGTLESDFVLDLLLDHDSIDAEPSECIGTSYEDLRANPDAAMGSIVSKYRDLEHKCDAVLIIGTDYTNVSGDGELAFNASIAANLGAPVVLVIRALDSSASQVRQMADDALATMGTAHAQVVSVIANRCQPDDLKSVGAALASLPQYTAAVAEDAYLTAPTVGRIMEAIDGELISGDPQLLNRECLDIIIGGMEMEHVLERLVDAALVITPGDRAALLLGLVTANAAQGMPSLSGIVLNGGFVPPEIVMKIVNGIGPKIPIIATKSGTFGAATQAAAVHGKLERGAQRKIDTARRLFGTYVDGQAIMNAAEVSTASVVTPLMFEAELLDRARQDRKHIVLPEGNDDRILRAASTLLARQVADLTILGDVDAITSRAMELGLDLSGAMLQDPTDRRLLDMFADEYAKVRAHKGMTVDTAREVISGDLSYFGTMMVHMGLADGMVSGALHTTANTIRPALQIIKTTPGVGIVSSVFLMCLADKVLVYGDCAVNPDPTALELADIAISSAETATMFGIEPRVAMLSYSTGTSGRGADVDKVREATEIVKDRRADLLVEGPIQYDAAVDFSVAATKVPDSPVAGRATVLIFPDLNTGNNTYKAVQRSAGAVAIGPVLQGLGKPVNDLSRGALVHDIVNTVAITAIQAQQKEKK